MKISFSVSLHDTLESYSLCTALGQLQLPNHRRVSQPGIFVAEEGTNSVDVQREETYIVGELVVVAVSAEVEDVDTTAVCVDV